MFDMASLILGLSFDVLVEKRLFVPVLEMVDPACPVEVLDVCEDL